VEEKAAVIRRLVSPAPGHGLHHAAVLEEVLIDVFATRMNSTLGAVYKVLHDARPSFGAPLSVVNGRKSAHEARLA
jgi:hypothetical protein